MVLAENIIGELEPKVRSIIKKQLGFSEPTLLAAAINSINAGASKDVLSSKPSLQTFQIREQETKRIMFQIVCPGSWTIARQRNLQTWFVKNYCVVII
jgi:hypothetical protein